MKEQRNKITGNDLRKELFRGNYGYIALGIISAVLLAGINLFLQWMVQQLMDVLSGTPGSFSLNVLLGMALGMLLVLFVIELINYVSKPRLLSRSIKQYTDFAFSKLSEKSISAFTGENSANYISALSNDTNVIQTNYVESTFTVIMQCLSFVGALTMMLLYSPILTIVAIGLTSLPIIASIITGDKLAKFETDLSNKNTALIATIKDSIGGFSVVKSFKAEKEIAQIVKESSLQVADAKAKKNAQEVIIGWISGTAGIVAQLGVLFVGAYMLYAGYNLSSGTVLAFTLLMNFVVEPISTVPALLSKRKAAKALMNKLADAINENVSEGGKEISSDLKHGIELNGVSFAYNEGEDVLKDINYHFEAGKSYAIVGGSGSGKSTLLNLLMQGHMGYRGEILFDKEELREINTASLYDVISIIQQNVFVFNRSIVDNITMFKDFEEKEIRRAIEQSGLAKLFDEKGKDYMCGENGSALSGGEKQRISIARSLLRRTPVLLVDEATAALDNQTAQHVLESILQLKDLTRIVVTHDLDENILKQYDEILVLKNGTIWEKGTFNGLMEQKGYFYSLYSVNQ